MMVIKSTPGKYGLWSITADGHADTREGCAAVSALLVALSGWVVNRIPIDCQVVNTVDDGRAEIVWRGTSRGRDVMEAVLIGLMAIAQAQPGIEINIEEV